MTTTTLGVCGVVEGLHWQPGNLSFSDTGRPCGVMVIIGPETKVEWQTRPRKPLSPHPRLIGRGLPAEQVIETNRESSGEQRWGQRRGLGSHGVGD